MRTGENAMFKSWTIEEAPIPYSSTDGSEPLLHLHVTHGSTVAEMCPKKTADIFS